MRPEYREEPCRSALNRVKGMKFGWSLNPYMGCAHQCTFCYVRAFEQRADRPSDDRYGASIRVKTNVAEVLRRELARRSWKGETVAIGAATDPYQPAEGRYRLTRACLEVLAEVANPFAIITRSPLIIRDIDVLTEAARRASVSVTFSVPTLDEKIWRLTEPNTPPPRQRLRALRMLRDAGIDAGVGMAPILPGLSDKPELLADVVKAARDAGATSIWTNVLYLRPGTREHFMAYLARDWPELVPRYERLYRGRAYLGRAEIEPVRRDVAELRHRFAVAEPVHAPRSHAAPRAQAVPPARRRATPPRRPSMSGPSPTARPIQLSLDALAPTPIAAPARRNPNRRSIVSAA
jgi:DNA repair photolyase